MVAEQALAQGRWVKLICGASNQDLAAIEDLCGIYALAGVHCIDGAADLAVAAAIERGIAWAQARGATRPWLMVSLSDGADPHFRKAWFDPGRCPTGCPRPCERVCPALAIGQAATGSMGVLAERCYGCGRCLPACPHGLIGEHSQVLAPAAVPPLLASIRPDAVEIHTQPGRLDAFAERLGQVVASGISLGRLAVSAAIDVQPAELWQRYRLLRDLGLAPLWQLDGRPMSGDVGGGMAHAAVKLLAARLPLAPPGPLQLAGGTNGQTLVQLQLRPKLAPFVAGVAFGGVARRLLQPWLLAAQERGQGLLADAELWPQALGEARSLVQPWLERQPFPGQRC
ncbi:4Fe-4S binding protein [Cyanobium sp. HWJ4-Hawea]|uniref:Light dependent period protein LdpA domain-containing protein n=1 Tax=unclassified Cyanobium TaxID=2627006 RepID=UPI0020CEFCAA|nr:MULTISPECIES: LdpA C-terminal domain-containing domain [unclassified Cyanobium]MCP9776026.1 4Fe-4S binding protein [Cyanobium sp. WAJ14-Wanaka]MCP9808302.1 4Fe-4S binding protein [Cyanobium sp. HWJ4-Hawea]